MLFRHERKSVCQEVWIIILFWLVIWLISPVKFGKKSYLNKQTTTTTKLKEEEENNRNVRPNLHVMYVRGASLFVSSSSLLLLVWFGCLHCLLLLCVCVFCVFFCYWYFLCLCCCFQSLNNVYLVRILIDLIIFQRLWSILGNRRWEKQFILTTTVPSVSDGHGVDLKQALEVHPPPTCGVGIILAGESTVVHKGVEVAIHRLLWVS